MLRSIIRNLKTRLLSGVARKEDLDRLYDQVTGMVQVHAALSGGIVLKPLRNWAISPDAMSWFLVELQGRAEPSVVEFGSGQSTIITAAFLEKHGGGRLLSVEHDKDYAAVIRHQLECCGLDHRVTIVIAPLVDQEPVGLIPQCKSYDLRLLPDQSIDVGLIDGPPMAFGETTRYFPLQWAASHLSSKGAIYLDDAARPGEQRAVAAILERFSGLRVEKLKAEKGLSKIYSIE